MYITQAESKMAYYFRINHREIIEESLIRLKWVASKEWEVRIGAKRYFKEAQSD